jgi:hypothetical protein
MENSSFLSHSRMDVIDVGLTSNDHVSISCPNHVVSTDKETCLDIHKTSYIDFVKIVVSNFTTEGILEV